MGSVTGSVASGSTVSSPGRPAEKQAADASDALRKLADALAAGRSRRTRGRSSSGPRGRTTGEVAKRKPTSSPARASTRAARNGAYDAYDALGLSSEVHRSVKQRLLTVREQAGTRVLGVVRAERQGEEAQLESDETEWGGRLCECEFDGLLH